MNKQELKAFLDRKSNLFNQPNFIEFDPIGVPHEYTRKQDIEIAGFIAAIFAWGQRKTIINKSRAFLRLMDDSPYDFILNHKEGDLKFFKNFSHRTFNATDALYFLHFFHWFYKRHESLEDAFVPDGEFLNIKQSLNHFFKLFFSLPDHPKRTYKHIPRPARKSACKRINMYLRWMVRKDSRGVDFGLWSKISPADLICPLDLHVDRIARELKLLERKQTDWQSAMELTAQLKQLDPKDPVKYDFALFGLGIKNKTD